MRIPLLAAVALVAVIGGMGIVIDFRSRVPVARPNQPSEPALIYASGRIEGAAPEFELRPQVAGRVARVLVGEGQLVNQGDILLQLDDQQCRQEKALAEAELALAEAQLERLLNGAHPEQRSEAAAVCHAREAELHHAEITWWRTQSLLRDGAATPQEGDNQRAVVERLRNEVQAARARLAFLEAQARPDEVRIAQARVTAAKARVELAAIQADHTRLRRSGRRCSKSTAKLANWPGPPRRNPPSSSPTRAGTTSVRSWRSSTPRA